MTRRARARRQRAAGPAGAPPRSAAIARGVLRVTWLVLTILGIAAPHAAAVEPGGDEPELIAQGARLFFTETFGGNGRTCGTCHPAENGFTLDPGFIATLPPSNPLFVAEFNPALAELEDPGPLGLLRRFALIKENVDGFDRPAVFRGVPHTFALATSVSSAHGPRTGWSGDGSPDGSLRSFATGAIIQHFPRTLVRVPGVDFRLPTGAELDALEAFLLSLGRQADLALPLRLKGSEALLGQAVFLDPARGKCNLCHLNAGAGTGSLGNQNFDTAVAKVSLPAVLPPDGGFGRDVHPTGQGFGDGTFNTPPLVEAAGTPPFFHNNAVDTIEKAVELYNGPEFAASPAAVGPGGVGPINLLSDEVRAVAAFLRVLHALESIRRAIHTVVRLGMPQPVPALGDPVRDISQAKKVLGDVGLHPDAVALLENARARLAACAVAGAFERLREARALLTDPPVQVAPTLALAGHRRRGVGPGSPGPGGRPAGRATLATPTARSAATQQVPCALFADVPPDHFAASWIATLVEAEVTAGCSTEPSLYCPEAPVTREQMAVLLLKARHGPGFQPPSCTAAPFADVPCASPFAPWVQMLVAGGITAGCGDGDYCPRSAVTREEMAVFLLRTQGVTPGPCTTPPFEDVPCASPFAPWVQTLVTQGIAAGCTAKTYCPTSPVTRAEMAIFLVKTFGLPF